MTYPGVGEIDLQPKVCGHCNTKTVFRILALDETTNVDEEQGWTEIRTLRLLKCQSCFRPTLEETVIFSEDWSPGYEPPVYILYPIEPFPPAKDMPHKVKEHYSEALAAFPTSPRASAAFLRLAIQQFCIDVGKPGKDLNTDIRAMVKEGLPSWIQQALDSVRVIGNNAVHPGQIDFKDNKDLVRTLFLLVNAIVEAMITRPREAKEIYDKLPQGKRDEIEKRDNNASKNK